MMDALIAWAGTRFTPEDYLFWTRIQCLFWTVADLVIVIYLTRIANIARGCLGRRLHVWPYWIAAATVLLLPSIAIAPDGNLIFVLELAITMPHFLLLIYVLGANIGTFKAFLPLIQRESASLTPGN